VRDADRKKGERVPDLVIRRERDFVGR